MHHSFAVTYAHLSLENLLFPCFQAFFIFKFRHILLAFCIVLWCNKYYTKRSACYVPQKTPNLNGRIRLSIVDTYYDKAKKCSRQKTIESIGWLDELEKKYNDPIAHFQKRAEQLKAEKAGR